MTQPTPYVPAYNFTSFQASFPTTPLPAVQVDAELAAIKLTTDQIRTNLAIIQRDDTALANAIVTPDSLAPTTTALIGNWTPRGAWANATAYAVRDMVTSGGVAYVCAVAHTSSGSINLSNFMSLGLTTGAAGTGVSNTFTAAQTISLTAAGNALSLISTDPGAASGPNVVMDRQSASPAAADVLGSVQWLGRSSTAVSRIYADLETVIDSATNAAESAHVRMGVIQAGSIAFPLNVGAGIYTANATGTDKGADSINAKTFYQDGALSGIGLQQWGGTSGGSANVQTISLTPTPVAYTAGLTIAFKAGFTNTGALTLNVNSLGAKNVFMANAACTGGEVISGQVYDLVYDGTQFQLVSPQSTQHGALIGTQVFSTPGTATYTPTSGTSSVEVEVLGGGGGGGGVATTGAGQNGIGGGGGGGGYARKRITSAFSGVTVTVGAKGTGGTTVPTAGTSGGTSSFGALVSATGGSGGGAGVAAAAGASGVSGGSGGVGSSGDVNASGQSGQSSYYWFSGSILNTSGGSSIWGGSPSPSTSATGVAGSNATGIGAGGNGGANAASQGTGKTGGDGSAGIVIVREFN